MFFRFQQKDAVLLCYLQGVQQIQQVREVQSLLCHPAMQRNRTNVKLDFRLPC